MDKLQQLTDYINRTISDERLTPIHLSLSLALCHAWMLNQFHHSYCTSRRLLMKASRIRSKATYHKAMKELTALGYIRYAPTYHPKKGSTISLIL